MSTRREQVTDGQPLIRFLERVRRSFAHDLRTPLGSIVNYASVLEVVQSADVEEVRDLGRRIRGNAQRAARMVQLLANATGLAGRPLRVATTDLLTLARSILSDANGRGLVRLGRGTRVALADLDAEVLGFAWRAYVSVECDTLGRPVDEAEIIVNPSPGELTIELRCGPEPLDASAVSISETNIELPSFLRHDGGPARLEGSLGLSLAQDLVISHGGDLEVWGRPGVRSGLRVRFPSAA